MRKSLLTIAVMLGTITASAHDIEVNGIYYNFNTDGTVSVTYRGSSDDAYNGEYSGDVVIPSSISYDNKSYKVTAVNSYTFYNCPNVTSVFLPNSVTAINSYAFANCIRLKSVTLPNSLEIIDTGLFYSCTSLASITIPAGVTTIKDYAFNGCANLSDVTIEDCTEALSVGYSNIYSNSGFRYSDPLFKECSLKTLYLGRNITTTNRYPSLYSQKSPFEGTTLETVTMGDNVTELRYNLFNGSALSSISLSKNITSIGQYTFRGTNISEIIIPDKVTTIGSYAFDRCKNLRSVTLPKGISSLTEYMFSECTSLTSISIPQNVTEIEGYAFNNCSALSNIVIEDSSQPLKIRSGAGGTRSGYDGEVSFKTAYIGRNLTANSDACLFHEDDLESIVIGDSVTTISQYIFYYNCKCKSLTIGKNVSLIESNNVINNTSEIYSLNPTPPTCNSRFDYSTTTLYVPAGSKEAYQNAEVWKEFTNIQEIGASTGDDDELVVNGIYYKIISEEEQTAAVTFRGETYDAYENEYSGEIVIPETVTLNGKTYTVTEIDEEAFYYCTALTSVIIPNSVKRINTSAFIGCTNLTSVTLPDAYEYLGWWAFFDVPALTSITLPNTLTSIGYGALANCPNLYEIKVAEGLDWLSSVDGVLFYKTTLVQYPAGKTDSSYSIPADVRIIASDAFLGNANLINVNIPETVTIIQTRAFNRCINLSEIIIPNSVTTIEDFAFSDCSNLSQITISRSVTSIGYQAFNGCYAVKSITSKATTPPALDDYVFYGINKTIPLYVPAGCKSSYETADQWKEFTNIIEMEEINPNVNGIYYKIISEEEQTAAVTFRGETYDAYENEYSGEIVIPETVTLNGKTYTVTEIDEEAFYYCTALTSVIIPNSVKRINTSAFIGCTNLTSVTLPDAYEYLGWWAFFDVPALTSITLPNTLTSIGYGALANCPNLYEIKVAEGLDWLSSVDGVLFYKTTLVQYPAGKTDSSYSIPADVRIIASDAFLGNANLINVNIPETVTTIQTRAFYRCINLSEIIIPNSVTTIEDFAFSDCSNLSQITISRSVTSIGYQAFNGCYAVKSITCKATTPPALDDYVFYGINKTIPLYVPAGCKSYYEAADQWKEFTNIIELEPVVVDPENICIDGIYYRILSEDELTAEVKFKGNSFNEYANEYSGDIVIPETITVNSKTYTVTEIGESAFENCLKLTSALLPNTIIKIKNAAFYCTGLSSITIPSSVTSIGNYVFSLCGNLTEINVDSNNKNYKSVDGILFNNDLTVLIKYPSAKKGVLYSIPNSVTEISQQAFANCNLTTIQIPNSVTTIGYIAFVDCDNLKSIDVDANNIQYSSLDGVLFNKELTQLIQYPSGKEGNYSIPQSVTQLGEYSFRSNKHLSEITIPTSVTHIQYDAFWNCDNITKIFSLNTNPPHVRTNFEDAIYTNATLYVPVGCKELYETADVWKEFTNIIETDFSSIESIKTDNHDYDAEYYNLNGVKVADDNLPTGFYIKRQNGRSTKIFVK